MKNNILKIGLLQCDHVQIDLRKFVDGDYYEIFLNLFEHSLKRLKLSTELDVKRYDVVDDVFPESPTDCDAWIITGSKYSVFDDLPWISKLKFFIQQLLVCKLPIIGVCFGHQLIALSLGGTVEKRTNWIVGVQKIKFIKNKWIDIEYARLYGFHEYEVSISPPNSQIIGFTKEVKVASFVYSSNVICFQYHFELPYEYFKAVIEYRKHLIGQALYENSLKNLESKTECKQVTDYLIKFLIKQLVITNKF